MEKHEEESSHDFTYDVFLSFRGEDTRYNFVGHVHKALLKKGIKTFMDDKNLGMRDTISPSLSKAIEESRIFVVVLSENYASSTWCLDELVKIIECKRRDQKRLFFPIFYHVEPSDIRHLRNGYGEHMIAHQQKFGEGSHKVEAWKLALSEASNYSGEHIASGSDKYESDLIEEIAEKLFKNIGPKPLHGDQNPVGLEDRVEEAKSLLDMKSDDVKMLGIYGLGGIGKTELAKALFDKIVRNFDAASFLADVREKSNKINGLEDLQKTLLSEMKDELEAELGSSSRGVSEIKQRLRQKKVLLVLDDVDDKYKLEKLAGGRDWFGKGSRIIITTRDKDVLIGHKVEEMYEMKELNEQHSLELFCWNAFKQSQPKEGFENVSLRAAGFAKSLPLALKVIGSDLATEETLEDWESALEDYERGLPNEKILNVLKTSYDRLGSKPKQVFLDIACFFKGAKKEYVESILEEFGGTSNIKLLCKKSLLTIEDGFLKMHDLIQEMGKEVVKQESSNPGERSRLWDYDNVIDVLNDDLGSDKIEGILLDPSQRKEEDWSGTAFEKMKRLRILIVRNISLLSEPQCLPNHLRVLDWEKYPSNSFPPKFHPKKIIIFNLPKSHLTLQKPFKEFSCLIKMDFSNNQSITEMPDVSQVQNLRDMKLDNCRELVVVHESVGFLKRLAHLSASGCTKLRSFLQIMFLPSLEVLNLNLCVELEQFPEIKKEMKTPLKIDMKSTAIQELPESISNLIGLVSIEMSNCTKLKYVPSSLFMLPNVVTFIIEGCPHLQESFKCFMPSPSEANVRPRVEKLCVRNANLSDEDLSILYCFPNLKELIASDNYFESLPSCIKECVNLTILDVSNCSELQNIPEFTNLRVLDVHSCSNLEEISELPSTIQKVDARYCSNLSEETSDMLWFQVKKEKRGIEVVMPVHLNKEIPAWFDFDADLERNEGNPQFWVRGGDKFPNVALALVFHLKDISKGNFSRRQLVDLSLLINGQHVPRKGHYNFIIAESHVLICDVGRLFSDEEWNGLDAFLNREWNVVTLLHEVTSNLRLCRWGAFVYRSEKTSQDDDIQFTCPNPEYSDPSLSLTQFPTNDPMREYIKMIQTLAVDIQFEKTQEEYLKLQETGSFHGHTECMNTLLPGLSEISEQAKQSLESQSSALDDPNSKLRWFLDTIKNIKDDERTGENEFYFNDDLAIIRLKDPVELNNGKGYCYNPELQRRRKIFRDGMTEGLVEAQKSFPSLNIVKTRVDTDNLFRRYGTKLFDIPEEECPRLELNIEKGLRIEGIVNALLVAKLNFYDLDVWATLDAILCREGMEGFHERLHPFVLLDPNQQQIMSHAFSQGMTDGLVEAQKSFPSLDIRTTKSAALNKGIIYEVGSALSESEGEMKIYIEGACTGLHEAKLSFPNLDVWDTLNALLSKKDMNRTLVFSVSKEEASTSGQGSDDPKLQEIMSQIFCQGVTDGLVEAHKRFPSLDIDTIKSATLNKGIIYRVSSTLPEPQGELKIYIEGVINGLHEAKLSFPNLDEWDTLTALLNKLNMNGASTSGNQGSDDPHPQQKLWQRFCEGMKDGLVEAQKSFPSLDIDAIAIAALKKGNICSIVSPLLPEPQVEGNDEPIPVETRIYTEGVVTGLREAKLTFPYLDVWGTLYSLLTKKNMNGVVVAPVLPSVLDKDLVRALRDTFLSDHVGEALTSGDHLGSDDPHQDPKMMKIFCDGMRDGLVEAKNIFSSLDIDTTTSATLNNIHKMEWPLSGPPGYPPLRDEIKMYIEGIYNGLRQAKLTFPDLDSEAIFNIVYMRTSMAATLPPPLMYSTCYGCKCETNYDKMGAVLKDKAEEIGMQYDSWIESFQNSEELHDLMTATYFDGLRDGLLETQTIYTKTKTGDCIGGCKYEKMGAVLKARVEESGRLYDVLVETFQNSDEFQDLTSAAYTNGLWDGLLQAQAILLAFYMSII